MNKAFVFSTVVCLFISCAASADTFGTGVNQLEIDFVTISDDTNPTSGYGFVNNDYRMGVYEITNDQWDKFQAIYGTVTGSPLYAYDENPIFTGINIPTNEVSWYEAAQFINWLNTSTGHQPAYNFTGTQGTDDYTFGIWDATEAWGGTNLQRHKDAFYFLPNEDEWAKAAYWNGTYLQNYSSIGDIPPTPSGWNFYIYPNEYGEPWNVGSGSKELNGTYDMMGNVLEWIENPWPPHNPLAPERGILGGSVYDTIDFLSSSWRYEEFPAPIEIEYETLGFRVAAVIPEPATVFLLALGGLALRRKR